MSPANPISKECQTKVAKAYIAHLNLYSRRLIEQLKKKDAIEKKKETLSEETEKVSTIKENVLPLILKIIPIIIGIATTILAVQNEDLTYSLGNLISAFPLAVDEYYGRQQVKYKDKLAECQEKLDFLNTLEVKLLEIRGIKDTLEFNAEFNLLDKDLISDYHSVLTDIDTIMAKALKINIAAPDPLKVIQANCSPADYTAITT